MTHVYPIAVALLLLLAAMIPGITSARQDTPDDITLGDRLEFFDFTEAASWPVGTYTWADDAAITEGRYVLVSSDIAGVIPSGVLDLDNFYAQVEVYPQVCESGAALGLVARADANTSNYYYFSIECDGFFDAGVISNFETREVKTQGALIQPLKTDGTGYVAGILANGSEIALYWDGARVGSFTDTRLARGDLGLHLLPVDGEPGSVATALDNLSVWQVSAVAANAPPAAAPPAAAGDQSQASPQVSGEFVFPPTTPPDYEFSDAEGWNLPGAEFVREDQLVRAEVIDGGYLVTPLAGTAAVFSEVLNLTDFYIEATLTTTSCPEGGFFGLGLRQQDSAYYVVGAICNGTWLAAQVTGLQTSTITSGALAGTLADTHVLGVKVEGAEFTVYWDGEAVGAFSDGQITAGDIGFHVQNGAQAPIGIRVDKLAIWEITAPPPAAAGGAPPAAAPTAAPDAGGAAPPAPAPTATPALSAEPCTAPMPLNALRYQETFDGTIFWPLGTYDFAVGEQREGRYVLTSTKIIGTIRAASAPVGDLYAQYQVTPVQCPTNAAFGLPVRISGPTWGNFYVAIMQCDGNWRLSTVLTDEGGNVSGEVLADGALDAPLAAGETYTLGILARGSEIAYYWNGTELARVTNSIHFAGDFGIQIRPSVPDYQPVTIAVDNFCVWKP
ncbi:MAG: hypothetical protein JXB47_10845 [Anaerolineae bacterium]|nr:hypothetical protein [Anaerolineae bacterium]